MRRFRAALIEEFESWERRFGERSRAIVGEYSIEVCADGIVAASQEIARRAGSR